eukprot:COSAG01_NODE_18917_length_1043_cov_14.893008_2_plen_23_part_01
MLNQGREFYKMNPFDPENWVPEP